MCDKGQGECSGDCKTTQLETTKHDDRLDLGLSEPDKVLEVFGKLFIGQTGLLDTNENMGIVRAVV